MVLAGLLLTGSTSTDLGSRALDLLDSDELAAGTLQLSARVLLDDAPASRPDLFRAALELQLPVPAPGGRLDLAILTAAFEDEPQVVRLTERPPVTRLITRAMPPGPLKVARSPLSMSKREKLWNRLAPTRVPSVCGIWYSGPTSAPGGPSVPSRTTSPGDGDA